jgi:hypothetical protein
MDQNSEFLKVLQHDLHKIRVLGALPHQLAMPDRKAHTADALAAWLSRNFLRESFEKTLYRKSLIFPLRNFQNPRNIVNQHRMELTDLFSETDAFRLHDSILQSKLINLFSEARSYPYSSLKYHILLTCAFYYNLKQDYKWKNLYLCENLTPESPFQIIYQDSERLWAILPGKQHNGLSRIWSYFHLSWDYRKRDSLGGDYRILSGVLSFIGSWSAALANIEDFHHFLNH